MTATRYEFRALVRTPASILSSPEDRERGYCEDWTAPGSGMREVMRSDWSLSHREESLATIIAWERREVVTGPWIPHGI